MSKQQKKWVLDVPFEWRAALSQQGARWDASVRESVYTGPFIPPHLEPFRVHPFSLGWHNQNILNGEVVDPPQPLTPFFKPREHQNEAILKIEKAYKYGAPAFLLADEVGVGKTMSAWGFALKTKKLKKILIVTTSSAQAHWRNTILHAGWLPTQHITIINYDRLGKLFEEPKKGLSSTRAKGKRKRLAKQGDAPQFDLVIFDESHKGKNPESARGLMMRKIAKKAKFCIFASATAGQNPIELVYLSDILAFATGKRIPSTTIKDFTVWCQNQGLAIERQAFGKMEWQRNQEDLEHIHGWLFGSEPSLGIRRLPEDLKDWPKLKRQVMPLELGEEERKNYALLWEDFLASQINVEKKRLSKGQKALEVEKNKMRLRQESSWLRIPSTVDMVMEYLEQGKKVAISCNFRKVLDELVRRLEEKGVPVTSIHGSLSVQQKEHNRLSFQKDPEGAQVVVFTVEEAISLHQGEYIKDDPSRVLLIHDIRWSAIQMSQIEGRCHRDGKEAPCIWLAASDTVDVDIAERMLMRVADMKAMHGDELGDLEDIEQVLKSWGLSKAS